MSKDVNVLQKYNILNTNISCLNGIFSNDIVGYACEAHNNPADFFLDIINGSSAAVNMTKIQNNGGTWLYFYNPNSGNVGRF